MVFLSPLIVVSDIEKSKNFYHSVLGLDVLLDFKENITLTGGVALQSKKSWLSFIHKNEEEVLFKANSSELYFEEDNFDVFLEHLSKFKDIQYLHPPLEHRWGQRVVRLYDLDGHIIEVGENMSAVCKRFIDNGMSLEETAKRMDVSCDYVKSCMDTSK